MSYLHEWHMHQHHFWVPAPWGLGEGPKGKISLNLNYKVNFKGFKQNFVYLLTNERYITYQRGFSFGHLGHAQGWDVGVPGGGGGGGGGVNFFFPKFNQIWCVCYSHEWHMHRHNFLGPRPLGPWGGVKILFSEHGHVAYQTWQIRRIYIAQRRVIERNMKITKHKSHFI